MHNRKMGRTRASASSSNSSSYESTSNRAHHNNRSNLSTDLSLGLSHQNFTSFHQGEQDAEWAPVVKESFQVSLDEEENECNSATFYVKVYMDGIPIGRKLDLLAHDGYHDLITTLHHMFCTNILWAEADVDAEHYGHCHVLTYEDKEGDWMMVGDVPWEMFLSTVRRLKITKC